MPVMPDSPRPRRLRNLSVKNQHQKAVAEWQFEILIGDLGVRRALPHLQPPDDHAAFRLDRLDAYA